MAEDLRSRVQSRLAGGKGSLQDSIAKAREKMGSVKPQGVVPAQGTPFAQAPAQGNPYAQAIQRGATAAQPYVQSQYPGSVAAQRLSPYAPQQVTTQPYPPQQGQPPFDRMQIVMYVRQWLQNVLSRYGIDPKEVYEGRGIQLEGGGTQGGNQEQSPLANTTPNTAWQDVPGTGGPYQPQLPYTPSQNPYQTPPNLSYYDVY